MAQSATEDEETTVKHFTIDARAMLTWGRDSIKDHTTALLELVKNGYDAGASIVEVEIKLGQTLMHDSHVRVGDDGCGMSDEEVDNNWLRLGYSEKLEHTVTNGGRRKTGEKGIGRISADRLGEILELRTQALGKTPVGLKVSWNDFERPGKDLGTIAIPLLPDSSFNIPVPSPLNKQTGEYGPPPESKPNSRSRSGTELLIRSLRQAWTGSDIADLRRELSILTSPFGGVKDFQIRLVNNVDAALDGVVTSPFYKSAEIEARFSYRSGSKIQYSFKDRDKRGKARISDRGFADWGNFAHFDDDNGAEDKHKEPGFGPVVVHLFFYPRISETLRGTDLSVGSP